MIHSPFHVQENFISPQRCAKLIEQLAPRSPDMVDGVPLKHERIVSPEVSGDLHAELSQLLPLLEQRYGGELQDDAKLLFQQYWENQKAPAEQHWAEGWKLLRKKWTRVSAADLIGILWLKDYHDSVPLDPRFEVFGGKLEFPAYDFSLTPQRGTLVIFPAAPHFVAAISHILVGSLEQIKFTMSFKEEWKYEPSRFPGTYVDWFVGE